MSGFYIFDLLLTIDKQVQFMCRTKANVAKLLFQSLHVTNLCYSVTYVAVPFVSDCDVCIVLHCDYHDCDH